MSYIHCITFHKKYVCNNIKYFFFTDRYAPCKLELRKLISHRQDCYETTMRRHEWAEQEVWKPRLPPPGWRLRSQLVAHLHEHKLGVNR